MLNFEKSNVRARRKMCAEMDEKELFDKGMMGILIFSMLHGKGEGWRDNE